MTDVVHIANGIPGSGKTKSFISAVDGTENILLVLPTKALTRDIAKSLKEKKVEFHVMNSDNFPNKVALRVEESLEELKSLDGGCVVVITHQTLTNINPSLLNGWKVVIDEVPVISNTHQKDMGANLFKDSFGNTPEKPGCSKVEFSVS